MADSTNLKSMIESETSKNNVAPVERRKNIGGGIGQRKLTPHPLNPNTNESTSDVQVSDILFDFYRFEQLLIRNLLIARE